MKYFYFFGLCVVLTFGCYSIMYADSVLEKELVVVVPSFNNEKWYERNLSSIYGQKYNNYRVIYIDDCSPDKTYELVKDYVALNGQEFRTKLIKNKQRRGALANQYDAIHSYDDKAIILLVDGDDWLNGDQVFATINKAYDDPNVWMTYGQFQTWPEGKPGFCVDIPKQLVRARLLREYRWVSSHLRTFYAGLFKSIKLKNLLYNSYFFTVTWDRAFMYPMLEMANGRWKFIPDVLYIYNEGNPLNDFRANGLEQARCERIIRLCKPYEPLPHNWMMKKEHLENNAVDMVIFSEDKPAHLFALLETLQQHMHGVGEITVLYKAENEAFARGYQEVKNNFSTVCFEQLESDELLSDKVNFALRAMPNRYCMFARDGLLVKDEVDLHACIKTLEQTHAYGFYLTLGKNIEQHYCLTRSQEMPHFLSIDNDMHAWQFKNSEQDWRNFGSLDLALYRKYDVFTLLQDITYNSYDELSQLWRCASFDMDNLGLCFTISKVVIIEAGKSLEIYLKLLQSGLKIASSIFEKIGNSAVKVAYEPRFIVR